jgi:hypothetical protein
MLLEESRGRIRNGQSKHSTVHKPMLFERSWVLFRNGQSKHSMVRISQHNATRGNLGPNSEWTIETFDADACHEIGCAIVRHVPSPRQTDTSNTRHATCVACTGLGIVYTDVVACMHVHAVARVCMHVCTRENKQRGVDLSRSSCHQIA